MVKNFRCLTALGLVLAGLSSTAQAQDGVTDAPQMPPEMNTRTTDAAEIAADAAQEAADAVQQAADSVAEAMSDVPGDAKCRPTSSPWITGDSLTSDIWAATDPIRADLAVRGDIGSSLAFRVGHDMLVRVEAATMEDDDPQIWLFDSQGFPVGENDDAGASLSSRVERFLEPGDYCVHVESFDRIDFNAIVQVSQEYQPQLFNDEEDITLYCGAGTRAVQVSDRPLDRALTERPLSWAADTRAPSYFRFSVEQATPIRLTARSNDLDPKMTLFSGTGRLIAGNDDADGTDARLDFSSNLMPGDYCLAVAPVEAGEGAISVSAETLDLKKMLREGYAAGSIVPPFGGEYPVTLLDPSSEPFVVPLGSEANWYNFNLDRPAVLVVETYGSVTGIDAHLSLKDAIGRAIAEDDDSGSRMGDAKLGPILLEPGRYNLALTDISRRGQTAAATRPIGLYMQWFVPME